MSRFFLLIDSLSRRCSVCAYRSVSIVIGFVLLTAATLKSFQVATEPIYAIGFDRTQWWVICVIDFELILGLWLLTGLHASRTRLFALGAFVVFVGVNIYQVLTHRASCGCFGAFHIHPWYVLGFDIGASLSLWCTRPSKSICICAASHPWRVITIATFVLAAAGIQVYWINQNRSSAVLITSPQHLDLGVVSQGNSKEESFSLFNPGALAIEVASIQTSCHCLKVTVSRTVINSQEHAKVYVKLDLKLQSDFTGSLAIELQGFTSSGDLAFTIVIDADVR